MPHKWSQGDGRRPHWLEILLLMLVVGALAGIWQALDWLVR